MADRYEKLSGAQQWFYDGLSILHRSDFFASEEVEMTASEQIMAQLRQQGTPCTYTHIVVRAVALALTRHPRLYRMMLGKRIVYPATIDIGMSVRIDDPTAFAPTFVIHDAGNKHLGQIIGEVIEQAGQMRERGIGGKRRPLVRKTARLIPFSWMRRAILRLMMGRLPVIMKRMGAFHVTCIPHLYQGVPFTLSTPAILSFARVEDRVVARDGQVVIRPMANFCMAGDSRLWNGNTAAVLLGEIKTILQEGQLMAELPSSATIQAE